MFFCRQSGVYPDVNLHSDIPVCASAEAKKVFSIPSSCQLISEQIYKYFLHFSAKLLNSNPLVGVKWVSWKPTFLTSFDDLHPWFPVRRIIRKRRGFAVSGCLKVVGLLETWADRGRSSLWTWLVNAIALSESFGSRSQATWSGRVVWTKLSLDVWIRACRSE